MRSCSGRDWIDLRTASKSSASSAASTGVRPADLILSGSPLTGCGLLFRDQSTTQFAAILISHALRFVPGAYVSIARNALKNVS